MKNPLKKSKKTLFKKTVFLLMLTSPFSAIGEIRYSKSNGNYRIYGHVENPTLKQDSGAVPLGFYMYMSRNKVLSNADDVVEYCSDKEKAAEILNKMLSGLGTKVTLHYTSSTSTDYFLYSIAENQRKNIGIHGVMKNTLNSPPDRLQT
ncbi:hypothetical protein [Erwinia aphidicola]|uniref:hypothetical protein n=1 Tax=Erwinia aphidicola TaxID=68334 RepID=UPI003018EEC5